jgi:hypothetical protein
MPTIKVTALATALGLLALPAPLLAQDLTPSGDRILSDPTYLPLQGQVEGDSSYQYQGVTSTNSHATSGSNTINTLSQSLDYGLNDDVTVDVTENYSWSHAHSIPATGGGVYTSADGFSDPSFGLTWRALDQRHQQPLDLDFGVAYAPNAIQATGATATETGTRASGGDALTLHTALGWETKAVTLQGYFNEERVGNTTVFGPMGFVATQSRWQPEIGIHTQARFTPQLSVNANAGYSFAQDADAFNTADGVPSTHEFGDYGTVGAAVNYHFIPNKLVGSLGYTHTFYGQTSTTYPLNPTFDVSEQRSGDALTAAMRYVFW